jgi:hypothetical protein
MSRKPKFDPKLLNEELNRFKLLENYNFYTGKQELPEYNELILGDRQLDEEEDESPEQSADDISKELGLDTPPAEDNGNAPEGNTPEAPPAPPAPEGDNTSGDMGGDDSLNFGGEQGGELEAAPAPVEPASNDVEVDVTELVKGSEEAKDAADKASQNSEMLLQKLSDLEARISSMDAVSGKIAELEQEIIKRNPTPVEKLEMRSLSSYPYSQKLTDYWADKKGAYDVMGNEQKEDYTLTQDDVENSYSEGDVKQSFTVKDDDYEEEDI